MVTLLDLTKLIHGRYGNGGTQPVPTDEELAKAFLEYIYISGTNQQKSLAGEVLNAFTRPVS
jgi:hypothetical protein